MVSSRWLAGGVALWSVAAASAAPAEWPQWRGPARDGHVRGAWPAALSGDHLSLKWHVDLAQSYSSPIVGADRVFTTESTADGREVVRAFDREKGTEVWKHGWPGQMQVPFFAAKNGSWIRATPALDRTSLYVIGMKDLLVCLDTATGNEKWRLDFADKLKVPLPAFGSVSSPLVHGDGLFVQAGASVLRLKKDSGEIVWRALQDQGGMMGGSFSSPVIATLAGREQLVVLNREKLAGLDLETGAVLWEQGIPGDRGMNILTPVIHGDGVLTSAYGWRTVFWKISKSQTAAEAPVQWKCEEAWAQNEQGYMSSPVVVKNHAYFDLRSQHLYCVDLATGEEKWTSDERVGDYASLVANGDHVLLLSEHGELVLFKAGGEKFDIIDKRKISESETWAHLVVTGGEIFVRELKGLSVWRWK